MAQSFALVQFFLDGSMGGSGIGVFFSRLIPMERVPARIVEVMQQLNGAVTSDGPDQKIRLLAKELDEFVDTCDDCRVAGPVQLPPGATIAVLCQNF